MNENRDGPPFEPGDIDGPRSLLVTDNDIKEVGASTPYGAVLRWWQALQLRDAAGVQRSYTGVVRPNEVRHQIHHFAPRFSQPIDPNVQTQSDQAKVGTVVRVATRLAKAPKVVSITDFPASFALTRTASGWKLRPGAYRAYVHGKVVHRRLSGPT